MNPTYTYNAEILRVVDADTLDVRIDIGFRMTTVQRIRLMNYNAAESRGRARELGQAATKHLIGLLTDYLGDYLPIKVRTHKADAFGRYLADVWVCPRGDADPGYDLVPTLLDKGWGVRWDGRGKRPEPWLEEGAIYPDPPPTINP